MISLAGEGDVSPGTVGLVLAAGEAIAGGVG